MKVFPNQSKSQAQAHQTSGLHPQSVPCMKGSTLAKEEPAKSPLAKPQPPKAQSAKPLLRAKTVKPIADSSTSSSRSTASPRAVALLRKSKSASGRDASASSPKSSPKSPSLGRSPSTGETTRSSPVGKSGASSSAVTAFNDFVAATDVAVILSKFTSLLAAVGCGENNPSTACAGQGLGVFRALVEAMPRLPPRMRELITILNRRLSLAQYVNGEACAGLRTTILGAGPVRPHQTIESCPRCARAYATCACLHVCAASCMPLCHRWDCAARSSSPSSARRYSSSNGVPRGLASTCFICGRGSSRCMHSRHKHVCMHSGSGQRAWAWADVRPIPAAADTSGEHSQLVSLRRCAARLRRTRRLHACACASV